MCGIVGFFVGCDLSLACPKRSSCGSLENYHSPFQNWDKRAGVRSAPSRIPEVKEARFPSRYVPILKHPLIKKLDRDVEDILCAAALYRFMNFTHKLELLVVNTVTANVALGRYNVGLSDEIRVDAHRIYVDEAYHALYSFEMMGKIRDLNGDLGIFLEDSPAFLRRSNRLYSECDPEFRPILELATVIVSEMLITQTLREALVSEDIDSGVSNMIADHARDENRHHGFYKYLLENIWSKLPQRDQDIILDNVQNILEAYTSPDRKSMAKELRLVGIPDGDIRQIIAETYDERTVIEYAQKCGRGIYASLEEIAGRKAVERSIGKTGFYLSYEEEF